MDPEAGFTGPGPAEDNALNQSLILARFNYDGTEIFRGPIAAHITDFAEDNFPDHCMAWDGTALIVSTGSNNSAKFRVVDLNGIVQSTQKIAVGSGTISSNIGNSLFWKDGELHIASVMDTGPGMPQSLLFAMLTDGFSVEMEGNHAPKGEDPTFPTGTLVHDDVTLIGYSAHATGLSPDIEVNPYEPRLAAFDSDWNLLLDIKVSTEAGMGHAHPTLTVIDDILYYAWSRKDPDGGMAPQVLIETYALQN